MDKNSVQRKRDWREDKRDIAPLPKAEMHTERKVCENDLELYAVTFYPLFFYMDFSNELRKAIKNLQTAIEDNGLFFQILPRGSGKTVLAIVAILWAVCYNKQKVLAVIGAKMKLAQKICTIIHYHLKTNELLLKAFPEICYPFTELKHVNQQSAQTYNGIPTQISISKEMIVIPTIEGSKSSGIAIVPYGLTGAIRGEIIKMPDGSIARPSFFLVDDPQTDESAKSTSQCEEREDLLQSAVLGLAGPGRSISGVVNGTIIRRDDMVNRYADGKYPEWEILKVAFLSSWPTNTDMWEEYLTIREEDNKRTWEKSNAFYKKNRIEMDKGAVAYWEDRLEHGAISAIQSAYNLIFRHGLQSFMSEFQNEPSEKMTGVDLPSITDILSKRNSIPKDRVKAGTQYITCGIDVHKHILFYLVAGFRDGGTCQTIDYGCFPKQKTMHFDMHNLSVKLSDIYIGSEASIITQGLIDLVGMLSIQEYMSVSGEEKFNIERIFIDSGYKPACVQRVKSEHKSLVVPSRGIGLTAGRKPISQYPKKPGEKYGHFLYYPLVSKSRDFRHCNIDVNYWKSQVSDGFLLPAGSTGEYTLFGTAKTNHDLFATHCTAETYTETIGQGRKVKEWKMKVANNENHLFDCLVCASAAASDIGMKLDDDRKGLKNVSSQKPKRIKLSDLQK